jgi:hypothetical protein
MGHDLHFLQRLERVSLPHVELAMSLYQDPQLVGFLLDSANLPDGAEKLAVSLDDPVAGPFLILARSGRFVTCLGAGMTIDAELPLITRSRLDSLLSKVADYRSRVEQAHKLAGNRRVTGLLRRIYTAGDELSREEFVALSAWAPLMPREFLSEMLAAAEYLERARRVLLPTLKRSAKGQEALLRSYWDTFWALGHLALLIGQDVHPGHDVIAELREPLIESGTTVTWGLVRQGFLPLALRAGWLAARLGRGGLPIYKSAYRRASTLLMAADTTLGLVGLACRHSSLRGEILKLLPQQLDEGKQLHEQIVQAVGSMAWLAISLDAQAQAATHRVTEDLGRRCHLRQLGRLAPGQDEVSPELLRSVDAEQAFPALANMPMCYLERSEAMSSLLHFMSFAAGAEAEQFYYRKADLAELRSAWVPEHSLYLLRQYQEHYLGGPEQPVRAQPAPGRNAPCPCQSGKKYKRCCGLGPSAQPGSELASARAGLSRADFKSLRGCAE